MLKHHRLRGAIAAGAVLFVVLTPIAQAATTTTTAAQKDAAAKDAAAQSQQVATRTYGSDAFVQPGTIVTLKAKDASKVIPATADTINNMIGVVISASDSAIVVTAQDDTSTKTYVATSGRYHVLVSDQGGEIKVGDFITVSALDGVGMKTGTTQGLVLGTAASAFDGKHNVLATAQLKDAKGNMIKTGVGSVTVDINIGQNPFLFHSTGGVPKTVSIIAQAITGTPVTPIRIYTSAFVLFMSMCVSASLLYSGVRGSFVAIGRNPLARKSIIRGLIQVVVTALIIFTFGLLGVYLILKL
ncbi:MAG: rane protein of unknown function [Candidatus Saccharibacteria bacterium]|nr:rane protein of unknown function [Candidatus Saccharibacteria bacterium]